MFQIFMIRIWLHKGWYNVQDVEICDISLLGMFIKSQIVNKLIRFFSIFEGLVAFCFGGLYMILFQSFFWVNYVVSSSSYGTRMSYPTYS